MILEFDAGNTRLKWRLLDDRGMRVAGGSHANDDAQPEWIALMQTGMRARVASVAGQAFDDGLAQRLRSGGVKRLQFAQSGAHYNGMRAGYRQPQQMGVDRWLALVAAWHGPGRGLMVVDAGSALTIDLVAADGGHLGGWIVPGLGLMRRALLGGTAGIRVPETHAETSAAPGLDTGEAVGHGTLLMAQDFVSSRAAAFREQVPDARLILTGGDADVLLPGLAAMAPEHVPELVLDGLGRWLP